VEHYAALLLVAALGGLAARRLALPGGTLLGALVASAAFVVVDTRAGALPRTAVPAIQVAVGGMLGLSLSRRTLGTLRRHPRLITASIALTTAIWASMAGAATTTGLLELEGAVLGGAPAGPAVSLLAGEQGFSLGLISLLLVMRYALVSGVLSVFLGLHARRPAAAHGDDS
jgi:uncharacterized membrane protein AbrB (regulator of aidB expression)